MAKRYPRSRGIPIEFRVDLIYTPACGEVFLLRKGNEPLCCRHAGLWRLFRSAGIREEATEARTGRPAEEKGCRISIEDCEDCARLLAEYECHARFSSRTVKDIRQAMERPSEHEDVQRRIAPVGLSMENARTNLTRHRLTHALAANPN